MLRMGLRDRFKSSVRSIVERFSGEYSAAAGEVRPDVPPVAGETGGEVKVTRARLKRPKDAKEAQEP